MHSYLDAHHRCIFEKWVFSFNFATVMKRTLFQSIAFSDPTRNEKGNCIHDIKMCDREDISKGDLRRRLALYLDNYKKKSIVHDNVGHWSSPPFPYNPAKFRFLFIHIIHVHIFLIYIWELVSASYANVHFRHRRHSSVPQFVLISI